MQRRGKQISLVLTVGLRNRLSTFVKELETTTKQTSINPPPGHSTSSSSSSSAADTRHNSTVAEIRRFITQSTTAWREVSSHAACAQLWAENSLLC